MPCTVCRVRTCSRTYLVACVVALVAVEGCGPDTATPKQRLDRELKQNPEYHAPEPVAKFAGRVTVNGRPPRKDCRLFVILNQAGQSDEDSNSDAPQAYAVCHADGSFAFTTNEPGDGVAPGRYVVTFVELHPLEVPVLSGHLRVPMVRGGQDRYGQPDELKNLYSDPDKNAQIPRFNLALELPGRDDHRFDLAVVGNEPVRDPGPNAIRSIPVRIR